MQDALKRNNWPILAAGATLAASVSSIAASQICLGLAILLTIREWRNAKYPPGAYLLLFFFAWTLLAASLSDAPMTAWPQVRKFFVYLIVPCLAAAYKGPDSAKIILTAMGAAGTLSAVWSLLQYARKYSAAQAAGINFTDAYIADRITGFMSHWMTFGGTMMTVFLIGAAYFLFNKPIRWRVPAALLIIAAALFLGWTRGIWIGTFAGMLYLIWSWRRLFVLAAPILAIAAFAVMPQPEKARVMSIFQPRGNTDSNAVVALDFVNRLGHDVTIASGAYWDIARAGIVEKGLMPSARIPGHAGRFETSMVMALRPDLIDPEGMKQVVDTSLAKQGLFSALAGATMQVHGAWAASTGYSDNPAEASAEEGKALLEIVVQRVSEFLVAFDQASS